MRHIVEHRAEIGVSTITHLRQIRAYFAKRASNEPFFFLPDIEDQATPGDLLIIAAVMQYAFNPLIGKEKIESVLTNKAIIV